MRKLRIFASILHCRMKQLSKKALTKLRNKYRLIIYNDNTFEEVLSYKLTRWNVLSLAAILSGVFMLIIYLLIAYTPIKAYVIPDFPKAEERQKIINNALLIDSLENQLRIYNQYITTVKTILGDGEVPGYVDDKKDSSERYENLEFAPSKEDSLMRKQIEEEEAFNLSLFSESSELGSISDIYFFPPVKGLITNSFNEELNHPATDIVSSKDDIIHAVHGGIVIFSDWSVETGYVLIIQHENDIISVYKHNSKLLKKAGDVVTTGEPIAIIGNTGEITTGPHLHFELWYKGRPVDSEEYIVYQ